MRNIRKKGISPVIATVILVAIAIVVSIAAAFWMTGLLSSFTSYEKLILSATITKGTSTGHKVIIVIINDGTISAEVRAILINGEDKSSDFDPSPAPDNPVTIDPGNTQTFTADNITYLTKGRPVKITVVTSRGSYETQLMAP